MKGQCATDDATLLPKPCVYDGAPQPLKTKESLSILKDFCPDINSGLLLIWNIFKHFLTQWNPINPINPQTYT